MVSKNSHVLFYLNFLGKKIKNNLFNLWKKNIKGMPVWKNIKQGSQNNNDDNKSNNMYLEHDD